jgi:uncharacterized protein
MNSCLYVGWVRHRRFAPVAHAFRYPLFMVYLDLQELSRVFDNRLLWSKRHPTLAWLRRSDYIGSPEESIDESVRSLVLSRTGVRPVGPIRMLSHLRYLGVFFSPLTLFYCYDSAGEQVENVVAEVSNTPWGERHCYVLSADAANRASRVQRYRHRKDFHVSPFLQMDADYRWRLSQPGARLSVNIDYLRDGARMFDATLVMKRRELTSWSMTRTLLTFPAVTLKVVAAIYWQALLLWLKGCRFVPHPPTTSKPRENTV